VVWHKPLKDDGVCLPYPALMPAEFCKNQTRISHFSNNPLLGERVKTIEYCFCEAKSTKQGEMKQVYDLRTF
jgi:hypothetical protein